MTYNPPGPHGYPPQPRRARSPLFWVFVIGLPLMVMISCTAALVVVGAHAVPPAQQPPRTQAPPAAGRVQPPAADNVQPPPPGAPTAEQSQQAVSSPQTAKVGDQVRDGVFAFTVTKTERTTRVGGGVLGKNAQGEFLVVHVTVKNVGSEAGHFSGGNQKIFDSGGREYSADSGAAVYMPDSKSLYEQINPGNEVKGVLLFDLPKGVKAAAIVLHDSMLSGGARVELGER